MIQIVPFEPKHAEALSALIEENLLSINARDYPLEDMRLTAKEFTPEKLCQYGTERVMLSALADGTPVGTWGSAPSWDNIPGHFHLLTIFVRPDFHGQGVGRMLMEKGEALLREKGATRFALNASATGRGFYEKMGYVYLDPEKKPNELGHYIMVKDA